MSNYIYLIKDATARKVMTFLLSGARSKEEIYVACHGFKNIDMALKELVEQNILEQQQLFAHTYYQIHPEFKKTVIRKALPLLISSFFVIIGTVIKKTSFSLEKQQAKKIDRELEQLSKY